MSGETFRNLKLDNKDLDTKNLPMVVGANGTSLGAIGRINCEIEIGKKRFKQTFLVCENLTRSLILGVDFAKQHAAGVHWTKHNSFVLTIDMKTVAETKELHNKAAVSLKKRTKLPPRSCAVVDVDINTTSTDKVQLVPDEYCITSNPNMYMYNLFADLSEKTKDSVTPFVIVNLSNDQYLEFPENHVVAFTEKDDTEGEVFEIEKIDITPRNWIPVQSQQPVTEIAKIDTETDLHCILTSASNFIKSRVEVEAHRKVDLKDKKIKEETRQEFNKLCDRFDDIISKGSDDIGKTLLVKMDIDTGDSPLIASKPYTLSLKHYDWVQKEITTLERAGIITKSISPWASPVVIVPKKSAPGEPPQRRMCVDFRRLNKQLPEVKNMSGGKGCISLVPLPKIDELYTKLQGYKVFSTLDLRSGYYHIGLSESAKSKTAFVVSGMGKFEFNRVPFSLAQAPAYFQRLINEVLTDCNFAMGYLDDIIIFSKTEEEHLQHLEEIFEFLRKAGLKFKLQKCSFFKKHIQYLGHLISDEGIQPLPEKLESIAKMPVPQNAKQVKQFLGLVGYYRKFVPHFSDIARPLTQLTQKNKGFNWTTECNKCFHMLKDYLQEALILRYPDPAADYILYTDASKYAYAGVLTQSIDGTDHSVAYTSRLFRGSQLNWAALTIEAYVIYMSVKKLSFYLDSAQITLRSDHLPLKKFLEKNTMNAKVNNWAVELESQNINFEFIAGTKNVLADTLSRLIEFDESIKLPEEEPGYEFGYTPFEELPPARITVIEEVIISENQGDQLPGSLKIQHNDPVAKDIKIELPLTNSKMKELQEQDPLVG